MKKTKISKRCVLLLGFVLGLTTSSCQNHPDEPVDASPGVSTRASVNSSPFWQGADMSYVNELQDCGVVYRYNGAVADPYRLIKNYGANLVRLRLWHNPTWTNYSTLSDVKRSISRAKSAGLSVLLDFHYSDSWTDPQQSLVPEAWRRVVKYSTPLADSVYNYTYNTLLHLKNAGCLPEMVQIGNETNNTILVSDNAHLLPTNYVRNVKLFNAGLKAVHDFNTTYSKTIKTILHIAMNPGDALYWLSRHKRYGLSSFDMLGVSYYPQWQEYTPAELGNFAARLLSDYNTRLFVAETGHIWTHSWNDDNQNLMSKMAPGYPMVPSPQFQKDFIIEVKEALKANGGAGFCVWEPFWVSAGNTTLWGVGSNWENVAFCDFNNNLHAHGGIEAFSEENVAVTFKVDMKNAGDAAKGYITGDFTDNGFGTWQIIPMKREGNSSAYSFTTRFSRNQTGLYYFLSDSTWTHKETFNGVQGDRSYNIATSASSMVISNSFGVK